MSHDATKPAVPASGDRAAGRDWGQTLALPKTDFAMRAGLPQMEPKLIERWSRMGLYSRLRDASKGRDKFVLHDGPPYANGNIHIGHALNKILKDLVTRSRQMAGFDSNYVPGWDCHGLPIEWKIEEQYIASGKTKPNFADPVAMQAFRQECRQFAAKWVEVQSEEFRRLGIEGDWAHPYLTMSFPAEAQIACELMKFAETGQLYRGSKPVMWSVAEKTALAEAEIEYQDYQSDMVWVKFPVVTIAGGARPAPNWILNQANVVIWTTTPWTLPGNRAISFRTGIDYGVYEVTEAPANNWAKVGERYILADKLAAEVMKAAKVEAYEKRAVISGQDLAGMLCAHPLRGHGYDFDVPLLDGDHVTDDAGTGFVHTAPGHGREDFDIWTSPATQTSLRTRRIDGRIPYTVDADSAYTKDAPGFEGRRVLKANGDKGDANDAVIKALTDAGMLVARARLKHQYPHSWRSKKPVIFRNTPQWFIHMDKAFTLPLGDSPPGSRPPSGGALRNSAQTLRELALDAIRATEWVPASGENRIRGMIEAKPDWVISRQRAWGVPITVFVRKGTHDVLVDARVNARIYSALTAEGADAWFKDPDGARFLAPDYDPADFEKINDVLDVWFDSGSTHTYVLEDPVHFPGLAGIRRRVDGGRDTVMYLEGSDQHRGWFHSSLIESAGTRGRAPFDVVLTHGFCLDEKGQKMSKSIGNVTAPQDVIKTSGADILRLWVASSDYSDDMRIGPEVIKSFSDSYRKMRNTLRWMLGTLSHFAGASDSHFGEPAGSAGRSAGASDSHFGEPAGSAGRSAGASDSHFGEPAASAGRGAGASDSHSGEPTGNAVTDRVPELERLMLHRLAELDAVIKPAYAAYDYKRVVAVLSHFLNSDLSAFYFDVRKDALYCEPPSSPKRRAALATVEHIFRAVTVWLAPILVFTAEEAWLARYGDDGVRSVHLQQFPDIPPGWRDDALARKWEEIRRVRRVVTGAMEVERAAKRMGSSLEAAPDVHVADAATLALFAGVDAAEVFITSGATLHAGPGPADAFRLDEVKGIAVVPHRAEGRKCQRSWRITTDVGSDAAYPDLSARDATAMREIDRVPA